MKRENYLPGSAIGASVEKEGEQWTLIVHRELHSAIETVWTAITDPEHLRQWAPFDADRHLNQPGTVNFSTVGMPKPHVTATHIRQVSEPNLPEYSWGDQYMRWELEKLDSQRTKLTLWHSIDKGYISMGAAGWHICFDVLTLLLNGQPIGRIVGQEAMQFGWPRLNQQYAEKFGIKPPKQPAQKQ